MCAHVLISETGSQIDIRVQTMISVGLIAIWVDQVAFTLRRMPETNDWNLYAFNI